MKGSDYAKMLESALLPLVELIDRLMKFQQKGAPCHTAAHTMKWLKQKGIAVIDWPARRPDLNPI